MANGFYTDYRQSVLGAGAHGFIDLNTDTIRVILVDNADYTVDLVNHVDLADAAAVIDTAGAGSVTEGNIGSPTIVAGVFDAADQVFTSVTGDVAESVVLAKSTGTASTSPLICYFDTFSGGMPVTPNGGNITIVWNASGIITL